MIAARGPRRVVMAALLLLALTGLACTRDAVAPARSATAGGGSTDWARLADRVSTPVLHWTTCRKTAQCATAKLPLNYDDPQGAKVTLALLRIKAKDPRHRLGTIFVNPGGPGDSARDFAISAAPALPRAILDRFDIVGVDPRGVGGSTQIKCFSGPAEETRALAPFNAVPFPVTPAEQRSWVSAAEELGQACSTTGQPIASAMSTTDDALDMDVLRRRGHHGPVRPAGRPAPGQPPATGRLRYQRDHLHLRGPDRRHRALDARP